MTALIHTLRTLLLAVALFAGAPAADPAATESYGGTSAPSLLRDEAPGSAEAVSVAAATETLRAPRPRSTTAVRAVAAPVPQAILPGCGMPQPVLRPRLRTAEPPAMPPGLSPYVLCRIRI